MGLLVGSRTFLLALGLGAVAITACGAEQGGEELSMRPAVVDAPAAALAQPTPGDPCVLGTDPDCIDPDGDGQGTYLIGGGDCIATSPDAALCTDLDGDGRAGYPDSEQPGFTG